MVKEKKINRILRFDKTTSTKEKKPKEYRKMWCLWNKLENIKKNIQVYKICATFYEKEYTHTKPNC